MYGAIENDLREREKLILRDIREKTEGQTGSPRGEWDSNQRRCQPLRGAQTCFLLCAVEVELLQMKEMQVCGYI